MTSTWSSREHASSSEAPGRRPGSTGRSAVLRDGLWITLCTTIKHPAGRRRADETCRKCGNVRTLSCPFDLVSAFRGHVSAAPHGSATTPPSGNVHSRLTMPEHSCLRRSKASSSRVRRGCCGARYETLVFCIGIGAGIGQFVRSVVRSTGRGSCDAGAWRNAVRIPARRQGSQLLGSES